MSEGGIFAPIVGMGGAFKSFISGEWRESSSGKTINIINPSNREPVYSVQGGSWWQAQDRRRLLRR